jgi:protein-S-isoprenylcysteine O-methyltransferase Ste14
VTNPPVPATSIRLLQILGAVLFVTSLALGGNAYVQRYDAVAPPGTRPWPALTWNVLLFSTFALHHSVLARTPFKRWLHHRVGRRAERSLYVIIASLLFLACTLGWAALPGTWYALAGPWWWVGIGTQIAGVVVTLIAARTLNLRELMGLEAPPDTAASPDQSPALETRGLYRLVRHPIYFGWVLLVGGAPLMTSTRLLFAVTSVAYLVIAIPFEERSLTETFGEAYRAYQRRVRWRLLPGVY